MAHLRDRFCLIPFHDLTECPEGGHHAIGSPYFSPTGQAIYPDPIIIGVRADIAEETLPRCSALGASCNTRPYHSYGPVMRKIFEKTEPHKYPEVRRMLEGVMEVGEVREIPPGGLSIQTDHILLGCVATMTAGTNQDILKQVLRNFAKEFSKLSPGCTLRMPIFGTGKARSEDATERAFYDIVDMTISFFFPILLAENEQVNSRKLLLVHPLEHESQMIANLLVEKGITLSILDKMDLLTIDKRLVYGLAHGIKKENCFVEKESFEKASDCLNSAIDNLLEGKRKKALQDAAMAAEIEPALGGAYLYINDLAGKKHGLLQTMIKETLHLAKEGRIREAYALASSLQSLGGGKKEQVFFSGLKDCYMDYSIASVEARLFYENYMQAEEALESAYRGSSINKSNVGGVKEVETRKIHQIFQENVEKLNKLKEKIPNRLIENTFHIAIRKLMADQIECTGARRALDNLIDLQKHEKIHLSDENNKACAELYKLMDYIEQNQENIATSVLQKTILDTMLTVLPRHGTLRLESARFYLKGSEKKPGSRAVSLTRLEIKQAWENLETGHKENPRDYGILAYLGFIIMMQGPRYFSAAEDFYALFAKVIEEELSHGRYGIRELKTPDGDTISIPHDDLHVDAAYKYYEKYHKLANDFASLAKSLSAGEGTASINLYKSVMQTMAEVGRYDLIHLYDEILGESWVALLSRNQQTLGSIPLPFGEISLDLIVNVYKKIRRWWKYSKLSVPEIHQSISALLENLGKKMLKR